MNYQFSKTLEGFSSSAVREILKLTQGNSIISFAGGLPAEEYFPLEAVGEAFERVLQQGKNALQYGLTEGYTPLRESICRRMATKGMNVTPAEMLLTTGSQQAIDLLTRIYIDPGDVILVEKPTYLAALQVFKARGASIYSVDSDQDGMDLEHLAAQIAKHKPKLVYVIPTFSNPTGKAWSIEKRKGLVEICRKANVLILEDDPYGEIQFNEEERYPTIFSLDEHPHGSCVVYTSTFSKTVAPALRTGWAIGDPSVIRNMTRAKQAADLHSSSLDQQTLHQLLEHFDLDGHIAKIRYHYKERMKFMAGLLKEHNWPGVTWLEPKGGMFFWVELPENIKAEELLKQAVLEGVAFVPGSSFYAEEPQFNTIRLNYTHTDRETTVLGMQKLSSAIQNYSLQKI
ncbi:aminotransferase-like domain-containing protein [Paenibacillus eucommiae]|uniref:2-aminoadipate transaminase n=1 Tax=Paenibacillus eucommiae TaxID=1355755 RepID=A0ABS4J191_9BACL|nr:PLP-dependent aminotransferase family protein [Paenibacillus eucommiae]MBP1993590.1 2-aminoadipate transaminase [Paenibacillus eucommiae]